MALVYNIFGWHDNLPTFYLNGLLFRIYLLEKSVKIEILSISQGLPVPGISPVGLFATVVGSRYSKVTEPATISKDPRHDQHLGPNIMSQIQVRANL